MDNSKRFERPAFSPLDAFRAWAKEGDKNVSDLENYKQALEKKRDDVLTELQEVNEAITIINGLKR